MTPIDFQVSRIMELHRYIDHDRQMTPIDFQVTSVKASDKRPVTRCERMYLSKMGCIDGLYAGKATTHCEAASAGFERRLEDHIGLPMKVCL
ncbi:hypothetical protein DPMN_027912 [Dreissena polymorpha]|uniref:Uncharacterized protein n=1 Tax=Dreissena polymorpha TaxID=45954 RepID=A0A9D4LXZ1_DREPO|nr:hypothetical protein DPMN_027912 [Dreissena polymorpha]